MSPTRSRPTMTGTAGLTHCGRWTFAPAGLNRKRLVCKQEAGHEGRHHAVRWTWTDQDRQPVERDRAARQATKAGQP